MLYTKHVRELGRAVHAPASARRSAAILRYLALEMPGGERGLDNDSVAEPLSEACDRPDAHPLLALLADVMRRRHEWRRRRTVLLLRRLSDLGRATCLGASDAGQRRRSTHVGDTVGVGTAGARDGQTRVGL